jgi:hypothetical protein
MYDYRLECLRILEISIPVSILFFIGRIDT